MPAGNAVKRNAHTTRRIYQWELKDMEYQFHKGDITVYRDYDYEKKYTAFAVIHHRKSGDYQIGTLLLTKDPDGYRIHWMAISRRYQGYGIAEWLYGGLLKAGVVLVSGSTQSPGAKSLWAKLMETFESNLEPEELDSNRKVLLWA
jgi:GNAT superfamily N-acetyltransferase